MPDDSPDSGHQSSTSETENESSTQSPELTLDRLFTTLADQRRRDILDYLRDSSDGSVDEEALIDYVLTRETDAEASAGRRDAVAMDVRHAQLPRLADIGLVETDGQPGMIRYSGDPLLEQWLTADELPQDELAHRRTSEEGEGG